VVDRKAELLSRLSEAVIQLLAASNSNWDLAFRTAADTPAEAAAWEAKVQALTVFGMLLGAGGQVSESG